MSGALTVDQQATFAALADVLIPAAEGMPSASAVGVGEDLLAKVLNVRPDLREPLMRVVRGARGIAPSDYLATLENTDPETFRALGLMVASGYYMSPEVRGLIGYPGQDRTSFDPDEIQPYEANGQLDRVLSRGAIWRDPRM